MGVVIYCWLVGLVRLFSSSAPPFHGIPFGKSRQYLLQKGSSVHVIFIEKVVVGRNVACCDSTSLCLCMQ